MEGEHHCEEMGFPRRPIDDSESTRYGLHYGLKSLKPTRPIHEIGAGASRNEVRHTRYQAPPLVQSTLGAFQASQESYGTPARVPGCAERSQRERIVHDEAYHSHGGAYLMRGVCAGANFDMRVLLQKPNGWLIVGI